MDGLCFYYEAVKMAQILHSSNTPSYFFSMLMLSLLVFPHCVSLCGNDGWVLWCIVFMGLTDSYDLEYQLLMTSDDME